jgi:hypothetical protein
LLFLLRVRYPNVSRGTETTVLAAAIVVFFVVCHAFLAPRDLPARPDYPIHSDSGRMLRR